MNDETASLEELKAKWAQLRQQTLRKGFLPKKVSGELREVLKQTIEAGTYISTGSERGALQALAREMADAIFRITSEYPTATIRAPIDDTAATTGATGRRSVVLNIPDRNPFFTGREHVLAQLQEVLTAGGRAALSGLGGVGKTQTALEYAHRHLAEYAHALWVTADSQKSLVSGYVKIAGLLKEAEAQDQTAVVEAVKRWLSSHERWLLILDNADDIQMAREFIPAGNGHVILTTRARAVGAIGRLVEILEMGAEEGALFLLRRAKYIAEDAPMEAAAEADQATAKEIAMELGGLPLALDQAAAYIEETGCGLSRYQNLYQNHAVELLRRRGKLAFDHPDPVATTWVLSFENIEKANPAATELLELCAFLHPSGIPEEVFSMAGAELGPALEAIASNTMAWDDALSEIMKYSLLRRDSNASTLEIHRLVQAVLKQGMDEATQRLWAERAVRAVNRAFPEVEFSTWAGCERLLPQAHACAELIDQWGFEFPEAARLLNNAGLYLLERARYTDVATLYERALAIREKALGPEHPDVAASLNSLAVLYRVQGRYAQAEPLYERAFAIQEKALGPEHPDVANGLNNLAWLLKDTNRHAEAEPLFRRALSIDEKRFGSEHPTVARDLNNLAWLLKDTNRHPEAESLFRRALSIDEKSLGSHPTVARDFDNLAWLLKDTNRHAEAESLFRQALSIDEKSFGSEHPTVARDLHNLGGLYQAQGQYPKAEPLNQRALAISEKALGPEHPDVARSLYHLAGLYYNQDQYAKAEPLYHRALAIREKTLGPEHPSLAAILNKLGMLYYNQDQYAKAESLLERALAIREKVLGPEHSDVATCLENYALLLRKMDREEEAATMETRAKEIRAKHA